MATDILNVSSTEHNNVRFCINGKEYVVSNSGEFTPEFKLVDFIRLKAGLTGTKYMCREGGCGACIVTVRSRDPKKQMSVVKAVNSCLIPVFSCNGWSISTIESLGNKKEGLHPIQQSIVDFNGTQCGFCTPGMIMSMNSLMESKSGVNVQDVEDCLDGNICRCTGYRPILDAFKSLAVDAPKEILKQCADIEDFTDCPKIRKVETSQTCQKYPLSSAPFNIMLPNGRKWIKVTTLKQAYHAYLKIKSTGNSHRIVAGNTAQGVYKTPPVNSYLDISSVIELTKFSVNKDEILLGSCMTIVSVMEVLKYSEKLQGFKYVAQIHKHLHRVANVPVKNVGTIGGNLMLKHNFKKFPSDIFMLLETVGAKLEIAIASSEVYNDSIYVNLIEFLKINMEGKFLISIRLPAISNKNCYFNSYKITKRYQNCHAYVNAGILMRVDRENNFVVTEKPRVVFQGIRPEFVHASSTESFLRNKSLLDQNTLNGAMDSLEREVNPDVVPGEAAPSYRKKLTQSLMYKTILKIIGDKANRKVRSGSLDIIRPVSSGKQTYDKDNTKPLYKATAKLEAPFQATGEAEYINDIPMLSNELFGAFVLTKVGKADIVSIDATEAMKVDGAFRFITAKDIPGVNNYLVFGFLPVSQEEPIFITKYSPAVGQPVGLMLADTRENASIAADKVVVTYGNRKKINTSGLEALKQAEADGTLQNHVSFTFTSKRKSTEVATRTIKGIHLTRPQYAFHMETQTCLCVPKEDALDVYSSTQWMDHVQCMVALALKVPNNYVNVFTKRVGGAFGAKITRGAAVANAGAVASYVTKRPVRVALGIKKNMTMIGKRSPYISRYEVKVDDRGKIVELNAELFNDMGISVNEAESFYAARFFQNTYVADGWEVKAGALKTDVTANTFTRAPGSFNGTAVIEYIMERIAFELNKDPMDVRAVNFREEGDLNLVSGEPMPGENIAPKLLQEIKKTSDYENRKNAVQKFNNENRWKKRGISVCPTTFNIDYFGATYSFYITIYHFDGSIAISFGGIEMGQGINTKVVQTVAHILEVPLEKIKVKTANTLTGSNSIWTATSVGSELCCDAAMRACLVLNERLKPVKEELDQELGKNATWEEIINAAHTKGINLSTSYMHTVNDNVKEYSTWTVTVSEVEVDMLTGEYRVMRVDLLEDVGKSLSPYVDIGQIEGAVMMAQGFWTSEEIIFDENTGDILTNSTWSYQPPESKDVPTDLRIALLHNAPNPYGVLRSKAISEPPMNGIISIFFALKNAIESARKDAGNTEWFDFIAPATPENVLENSLLSSVNFTL